MSDIFALAAQNTAAAFVLAVAVFGLTRVWRNPPAAHLLWLLVLVKLVTPPLIHVHLPEPVQRIATFAQDQETVAALASELREAEGQPALPGTADQKIPDGNNARGAGASPVPFASETAAPHAAGRWRYWAGVRLLLLGVWLGGTAALAIVSAVRIWRFECLLQGTLPASGRSQRLTSEVAERLGMRRPPELRFAECVEVPMVWWAGRRPRVVLPVRLSSELDERHVGMILAHELAHLRRRDHWVRVLELFVSLTYWWNPLVWAVRRQLHYEEDLCCDAWVRHAFPNCTKHYAEVVLKAAESFIAPDAGARLLPASLFFHSLSLKARIEMILESRFAPSVSLRSMSVVALLALLVLPSFGATMTTESTQGAQSPAATVAAPTTTTTTPTTVDKPSAPARSEFPHVVKFQQGATKFLDGDKITIVEVRGTAEAFASGNTYQIKGTYTLASHDHAMLAAFVTAKNAADGRSKVVATQTTNATKGSGSFTLVLPMPYEGWPHVSFYGRDGQGFGGNYFGTGDSVLKQWWR